MRRTERAWRKIGAAACAAALLLLTVPMFPAAAEEKDDSLFTDEMMTYQKIEGGVRITDADSTLVELNLNRVIDGYPILEIGPNAFSKCTDLKAVDMSKSTVKKIDEGAFNGCYSLKEITLPKTLESIGNGAFYYCGGLTELELPDSLTELGEFAFGYCMSLKELRIPKQITALPKGTFFRTLELQRVELPDTLESIATTCFVECYSLEALDIPASVKQIDSVAVISCPALKTISVGEGNPNYHIGSDGVLYNSKETVLMLYPAGSDTTEVQVPDSVQFVDPYAFSAAPNLTKITLPETVTDIGEGAFSSCTALKEITLPVGLTKFDGSLFADCTVLESVAIPESVKEIGAYAFFRCAALSGIQIPDSVTKIGEQAFCGCDALHEVKVPETVTDIGDYALGFTITETSESNDGTAAGTAATQKIDNFVLYGSYNSMAEAYAKANDIQFKGSGFRMVWLIAGIIALFVCALIVLLISKGKRKGENEAAEAETAEEPEETDPSYHSILGDETEEDPYDRRGGSDAADEDDSEGDE